MQILNINKKTIKFRQTVNCSKNTAHCRRAAPQMRSLLDRTAMAQVKNTASDSCRPAGKPICRRVPRTASVGLALRGKLYKLDNAESSLDVPRPQMRSLHGRTAMAQGETPHQILAVTAGKPICRRVPRLASVALALHGSLAIPIMWNPHSTCRPRRCAHYMAEQRWLRGKHRIDSCRTGR